VRRIPFGSLALAGAAILAVLAVYSVRAVTGDFLYVPNEASPVAGNVEVAGHADADKKGGIYFVDVVVREERLIERILPFVRPDGASVVPGEAITARGETFEERRAKARAEMTRSEQTAAAVAFRAGGLKVTAIPRGVLVSGVESDVPAADVLSEGDVITGVGETATKTPSALRAVVGSQKPGTRILLHFRRGKAQLDRMIKTVRSADGRTVIGIQVDQDAQIKLPFAVKIDLGEVGGPSAGLPFALEILQELGNDVDRGYKVAATGEILLDGTVGPVGGLKQKTFGVKAAGADIFLVPAGENATTARRYAGGMRIVPVESFQQALRVLKTLPVK
jgi:Lon-like protease